MPNYAHMQKLVLLAFIVATVVIPVRLASRSPQAGPMQVVGWMLGVAGVYWIVLRFVAIRLPV